MRAIKYLCLLLAAMLLCGCGVRPREKQFFAMDTVMTLTVWGDASALTDLQQLLQEADSNLSVTKPNSLVSRLNRGEAVTPEEHIYALLENAAQLGEETEGRLDLCLYPVTRLWGFTTGAHRVPTPEDLSKALSCTGNRRLILENGTARLESGAQLDLGAVAKGWAGAQCVKLLQEKYPHVSCAMLRLGGNIQTYGTKPQNKPWRIGIQSPTDDGLAGVLELTGTWAVVTSGGYERHFEENSQRYCHIIDPATGFPVENDLLSVTVVSKDGLQADGLSTALYVMGLEKAAEFWRQEQNFEAILLTADGAAYVTPGLRSALTLIQGETVVLEGQTPY